MHRFLLGALPVVVLVGCSCGAPVQKVSQPCIYKDQNLCKERELLQMKTDLFLTTVQKYNDCLYTQSKTDYPQACGKRPEWKDFK